MGRPYESNRETYQFLLDTARKTNDRKAAKDIQSVSFDRHFYRNNDYRRIVAKYLDKYGGGMKRSGYSNWQGMKDMLATSSYTWKEKWNILQGTFASYEAFGEMMTAADVLELAPRLDIPMYIIHGAYDYQTTFAEATRFFHHVEAPFKTLFTFHDCAHAPFLEDQQRFMTILQREVLPQTEDKYSSSR